jgi:Zn-dependent peptidase ImmA (M78 family)
MRVRDLTQKLAKEVLRTHWNRRIPVDPAALATSLDATVIAADLGELSGQFTMTDSGPVIRYNQHEARVRQRFSIAHELGHYVLSHGDAFRDPAKNFRASQFDHKEIAANQFAAEVLMPEEAVSELIQGGISNLRSLAAHFDVSEAAMKYRLKKLGWVS